MNKGSIHVELNLVFIPMAWQIFPIAAGGIGIGIGICCAYAVALFLVGRGRQAKQNGPCADGLLALPADQETEAKGISI